MLWMLMFDTCPFFHDQSFVNFHTNCNSSCSNVNVMIVCGDLQS